jgi:hypothetical protein
VIAIARLALRLAALVTPPPVRDAVIGDLLEEAALRGRGSAAGSELAAHWLLVQLLRSLPALLLLRARASQASLLAVGLTPAAVVLLLVTVSGLADTRDLTPATMRALILQLSVLGIALALPLYVADDLDVSVGPVAMLGLIWAVSSSSGDVATFFGLLPLVGAAGLAVGLLNGVLTVRSRLPSAAVTLASGTLLCAALSQTNVHLAVLTPRRLTLDAAALALALVAVAALAAFAGPSRRRARAFPRLSGPPPGMLRVAVALLVPAVALLVASGLGYEPARLAPVHGAPLFASIGFPLLTALLVLITSALLTDPARRTRSLWTGAALLAAMPLIALGLFPNHVGKFMAGPVLGLPLLFVVATAVDPGAWPPALSRSSASASGVVRVAALATSAALAAIAGAMMGAQGVRDAGFLSQGAFVSLLPLIALLVGGQQVLPRGRARLAAAVGGALLTAALAVAATQPSDNLAPGLLPCLLLAIVAGPLWRLLSQRTIRHAPLADA